MEEGGSRKRLRPEGGFRTKRPTDKKIVSIGKGNMGTTNVATDLITATFPCTITGLRWNLSFAQDAGTGLAFFFWAIVIQRDGELLDIIGTTDGGSFYNPEQNVLTHGVGTIDNHSETKAVNGTTKSMRKLMGGDKYVFVARGTGTNTSRVDGQIQFFCKT